MTLCLYKTSNFVYCSATQMFKRTKKPYITVPLGLKLLFDKVQCYCLLEMFIIHLGSLQMGRWQDSAGCDALTG